MVRLALILHVFISSTLVGVAIVVALVMGASSVQPLLIAAALGFVAAMPVSWQVARQLYAMR